MKSESILNKLNTRMARWFRVTCEDTTPLILEVMDHGLPLGSRIRLAVHLAMCGVCGFYKKQIEVIRALANKLGEEDSP
ncbi:MAG: hypothetical protein GWM98_06870, partial [Nitrospinaceae bacterium]|nr:zf-HC2 domain-containing protein [Nitrospinaceae bacterium]NIR54267.1 zf-HC2 domain-containing protein [Nitrospinaceae bacterium]NIS84684.1 zf-HC2 domain-containing protein [Nitrospinaceae bacterium]NIT81479.1 zf-HC2 domain-containing protein [Nitrospinaceae bacterium]NIU43763.1 zf-HC2 domain-containing protein [Nitrospinaceae bacterium]